MSGENFATRAARLHNDFRKDEGMARRSSSFSISPEVRVGLTIQMFAGACTPDLMQIYTVPSTGIAKILQELLTALTNNL